MRIYALMAGLALSAFSSGTVAQFNFNRLLDTTKNLGQSGQGIAKNLGQATQEINEQQELDIGREYAALLVGAAPLLENAAVQRYVNRVGRWLSLQSERPDLNWQFGVLDSDNINAFATPGGYVLVTKGLLSKLKSEAELAGVLAHEIAHVVKKHHLAAMRKGAGIQAGASLLSEFAAQKGQRNPVVNERLISGIKEVMLRGLDKDDEFEADRMGVVIAARAGYDPYGLPSVLQMLQGLNPQDSGLALLFATHPDPNARLDALERVIGTRLDRYATQPQATERFSQLLRGK